MYIDCQSCNKIYLGVVACPVCDEERKYRLINDSYVEEHTESAYQRGLFTGNDISDVQSVLLKVAVLSEESKQQKIRNESYEWEWMLHDNESYRAYKEQKEELNDMGLDHIEYIQPSSVEEADQMAKIIEQMHSNLGPSQIPEDFISFTAGMPNIDIDKLAD